MNRLLVNTVEWQPGASPPSRVPPGPWSPLRHLITRVRADGRREAACEAASSARPSVRPPVCRCVCLCGWLCACLDVAGAGQQQHHFMVDVQLEEANRNAFRPEIATNQVASWAKCRAGWNAWNICFSCSTSSSGWVKRCAWKQRYCYF